MRVSPDPYRSKAVASRRSVLDVSVLGRVDVRVDGRRLRTGRAKSVELLVYLVMQQGGADADQLWEALWPDRPMSPAVLHTTVSVARRSLRESAEQPPLVSDARDGRLYHLAGPFQLDWDRFVQLAAAGRGRRPASAEALALGAALDLVRGAPFTTSARGAYDWARSERTEIEAAIGSVAERLGQLRLERGDVIGARQAARRGLRGAPYDERLYRLLMQAAHASDHPGGVESVMHELVTLLGVELDDTEWQTRDLYQQLRRGRQGGARSLMRKPSWLTP
ncbi:MAG: AfsR/SARP family transcriptional regulator [Acidimicrobiales bacterium]